MEQSENRWRLILSPPDLGAWNMALDDAILEAISEGISPPTLRLYAWEPPCLSLGYAQSYADVDHARLKKKGWDLVRRPSGGRAILHTDELTYALIAPNHHRDFKGGVLGSYRHFSQGLVKTLVLLGLKPEMQVVGLNQDEWQHSPVCFQIPSIYEITVQGKKLVGSAQVRRRNGALQHGTLPLTGDITRICQVMIFANQDERREAMVKLNQTASTVEDLLGRAPSWLQAAEAMVNAFTESLDMQFDRSDISAHEKQRAEELMASRYGHREWMTRI
ncbi:MAG: biotin/lipoate A/B protein ligase family protein [Anaerolineales bacterium]|jgi:lipoate-protein ligase A